MVGLSRELQVQRAEEPRNREQLPMHPSSVWPATPLNPQLPWWKSTVRSLCLRQQHSTTLTSCLSTPAPGEMAGFSLGQGKYK